MNDSPQQVPLQQYLIVLRRYRMMIIVMVAVAAGVAIGLSASTDPEYRATASVAFNDQSQDLQALGVPAAPSQTPDKVAAARASTIRSELVAARVRTMLQLKATTSELQGAVTTEVQPADNLVAVTATSSSGALAAKIANAFASEASEVVTADSQDRYLATARDLEARARKLKRPEDIGIKAQYADQASKLRSLARFSRPVDIVRPAEVPAHPSSPKPVRDTVLAVFLALVLGVALAFVRHSMDRRIRSVAEAQGPLDLPLLGYIREEALGRGPVGRGKLSALSDQDLEPFRILRTNLAFMSDGRAPKILLVTSPLPEEGKSTVSTALAYVEAMSGRRTLLVDCDLRRPSVGERLGLAPGPGIADYLLGKATPEEIVRTVSLRGYAGAVAPANALNEAQLVCITAGTLPANPAELLGSERFREFLAQVSEVYDHVIIDSPPLLPVGDTLEILSQVDGVLLCLRLDQTTREQAAAAKTTLGHFPSRPTGLVMTGVGAGQDAEYAGAYAYTHAYSAVG